MYIAMKAARRDAMANLKCFCGPGHQRHNFDGFVYVHCAAPPYSARSHQRHLPISVWQSLVGFRLLTFLRAQRLATKQNALRIYGGWVKTPVSF